MRYHEANQWAVGATGWVAEAGQDSGGGGNVEKERLAKDDGRYIIFYTFEQPGGVDPTRAATPRTPAAPADQPASTSPTVPLEHETERDR